MKQRAQHESQIRELNASLEERNEQVAQLEAALVELQIEVEAIESEKGKLEAAQQQRPATGESDAKYEAQLTALKERLAALEEELASALRRHNEEVSSLRDRLGKATEDSERRVKTAEDDRDLFRRLYDEASTHAQRLAKENVELEEALARALERIKAADVQAQSQQERLVELEKARRG